MKLAYPLAARDVDLAYNYRVNADLLHVAQTVVVAPEPMKRLINTVAIVNYDEGVYIPTIAHETTDDRVRFIPRAESILYSNLRRTVQALTDVNTPERYRRRFEENNPIQGAIWHYHLLVNADEVIPHSHTTDDLRNDIALLGPYMSKLQKHVPKMAHASATWLMAPSISRVPGRYRHLSVRKWPIYEYHLENQESSYRITIIERILQGTLKSRYYAYAKLSAAERLEGQINLLGELPRFENLHPTFLMRTEHVCKYQLQSDYKAIAQILYAL